jgi:MraZ protein|tara:strand:- start:2257 stop:2727 length:471 start_codon:yes stop_codon:yes gene_type:complete
MLFTGTTERSIDDKHRLSVPTEMRCGFAMGSGPSVVYASPGVAGCICLWPEATFEALSTSFEQSLLPDEDVMEYEQILFSQSRRLEIDKAGRIRLPETLLEFAEIGSLAVVIGVRDHLELRNPERWNASVEEKLSKLPEILSRARNRRSGQTRETQ